MMKSKFYLKGLLGLVLLAVIVGGCKKDEEVLPEFAEMAFDSEEVLSKLPAGLTSSTDEYAQQCVGFIESAVDMSGFLGNMVPPDYAQKSAKKSTMGGDTWTWTWSYGGESFTFYWTYDEDNTKNYWTMEIQFGAGPIYDYIDAWELKDGSQGEVMYNFTWAYIYGGEPADDYEALYWKYTWRTDGTGAYYFNWYIDSDDPAYEYALHYEVTINPDGSGFIDYYLADALFYYMEWDALGNGSWVYYFGDSEYSGTWSAG